MEKNLQRLQDYFGTVINKERSRRSSNTLNTINKRGVLDRHHYQSSLAWLRSQIRQFLIERNEGPQDCILFDHFHIPICCATDKEIQDFAEQEIPYPASTSNEQIESLKQDRKTLRRRLNQRRRRERAELSLRLGLIGGKTGNKRATPVEIDDRKLKNRNTIEFMNRMVIVGQDGETLPMAVAAFTKKKKLSEIYTVLKGIQDHADSYDMDWIMAVITLPPRFHPNPSASKSSWDGTLPNQSRREIGAGFARVQDRCRKNKIKIAGFWTIESHQDGCPHANFFIYSQDIEKVQQYLLDEFEVTSKSVKFKGGKSFEDGKPASFASYCTKYIMKGFSDANAEDPDVLGEEAWASAWSIRRLGFFGIPSREQWRRLRASHTPPADPDPLLKRLWISARGGRFGEFIGLMGGLGLKNNSRPIETIHQTSKSGRSKIAVGVILKNENPWGSIPFITKKIGYWQIRMAEDEPLDQNAKIKPLRSSLLGTYKVINNTFFSSICKSLINSIGYPISRLRLNYPSFAACGLDREASPPWTLPPHRPGG